MVLDTRRGPVAVGRDAVVALRRVPPPPVVPVVRRAGVEELTRIAADAWPPVVDERLGDWRLRWADGYTKRANSALALGGPGVSLAEAVDRVAAFYADHAVPARIQLADGELADQLEPVVVERGFTPGGDALVEVADAATVARDAPGVSRFSTVLDPAWLAAHARSAPLPSAAAAVLGGGGALLAGVPQDGVVVAIARLHPDPPWAMVSSLWVHPDHRGRGLGEALTRDLAARAMQAGCRSLHLQVEPASEPARRLYRRLGFTHHHRYRYWTAPD